VAVAATSRVVPVLAALAADRIRRPSDASLGSWFADRVTATEAVLAIASVAVLGVAMTAVGGTLIVAATTSAVLIGVCAAAAIVALRGGLDGDGLGAIVELSLVAGLGGAAVAAG
jgi:cobalamin synthase